MVFMLVLLLNTEVPQASALGFVLLRTFVFLIIYCIISIFIFSFAHQAPSFISYSFPPVFNVIPFAGNTTSILSLLCNIPLNSHTCIILHALLLISRTLLQIQRLTQLLYMVSAGSSSSLGLCYTCQ